MKKIQRFFRKIVKNKIFWGASFLGVFFYVGLQYFNAEDKNLPDPFRLARERSVAQTADIVALVNASAKELAGIADKDKNENYEAALKQVSENLSLSRTAEEKAASLATDLEIMAQNLANISPMSAQRAATAAIGSEVTLVSHLVAYNDNFSQLLESLRSKFLGEGGDDKVKDLVAKINKEIGEINGLNGQLAQALNQFDGYFK